MARPARHTAMPDEDAHAPNESSVSPPCTMGSPRGRLLLAELVGLISSPPLSCFDQPSHYGEIPTVPAAPSSPTLFGLLHLDSNAVNGLAGSIQYAPQRLRCHLDDQAALSIPLGQRCHHISVWRQCRSIGRNVVDRPLHLIEYEDGRPSVVVQCFLLAGPQGHLEHSESVVLENHSVVFWRRRDGIESGIPG